MEYRDTAATADLATRCAFPDSNMARLDQLRNLPEARLPSLYLAPEDSLSAEG